MSKTAILMILCGFANAAYAQPAIDSVYTYQKLNRSLRFAQLTLGGDALCRTGGRRIQGDQRQEFGVGVMPRVTIGGLHFWGHADFYVTFPLGIHFQQKPDFASALRNTESVETGLKIYPLAIRPGRLAPYLGISFQPFRFGYKAAGERFRRGYAQYQRFITPVQLGLTFATGKYLFTAGLRYNWRKSFDYYRTPADIEQINVNPVNFNIAILRYIDTDKGMGAPKSVLQQNLKYHILKKENRLNSWYWGVGPSAAFQMSKSGFLQKRYRYLADDMLNSFLVPELTAGYFFAKPDINVGLAARTMGFKTAAFDTKLLAWRSSLSLEAYKFLFDYHGFVPYVGPMLSFEHLSLKTNGIRTAGTLKPALGIVFGWDIRVTKTGASLLRTNLRYTPGLHLDVAGERLMFNHLEFNFIQKIHFIGRNKVYRRYRKP